MTKEELVKGLKILGLAYNKGFSEEECVLYYEFLQRYNYETLKNAVKELIQKSKFLPKISEIINECENNRVSKRYRVLELMKADGYFKSQNEYEKATHFVEDGVIPSWLKEEMKKYIYSTNKLENKNIGLLN